MACAFALSASNVQADMLVFWNFDQSYYDGTDYVTDSVSSQRLNLVDSSVIDGKLSASGGFAQGTAANNGLDIELPTGRANFTLSAFLSTRVNGAVGIMAWGRNANYSTNSFRTINDGLNSYWWGADINARGYREVFSGFENYAVATGVDTTHNVYLNGQLIATGSTHERNEQNERFVVGSTANNEKLFGTIDNASVYNDAMEHTDIISIAAHSYNGLTNWWKAGERIDRVGGVERPGTITGDTVINGTSGDVMVFNRSLTVGEQAYYQGQLAAGHSYVIDNMAGSDPTKTTWLRASSANITDASQTPLGIYVGGTTTESVLTATAAQLNAINRTLILGGGTLALSSAADATIDANRVDFNGGNINLSGGSGKIALNSTNRLLFRGVALNDGSSLELNSNKDIGISGALTGNGNLIKNGTNDLYIISVGNRNYTGTVQINAGRMVMSFQDIFGTADSMPTCKVAVDNAVIINDAAVFNNMMNTTFKNGARLIAANGQGTWKAYMLTGESNIAFSGDGSTAERPVVFEVDPSAWGDARTNATICPMGTTFKVADITKSDAADLDVTAVFANTNNNGKIGVFTKTGEGTMRLAGANTYSGGTTLQQGEIIAANDSALGTGAITIEGGTLTLGDFSSMAQTVTTNGALNISGGQINFDFVNVWSSQFDNINLGSGALNISGGTFNVNFVEGDEEMWFNNAGNGYALITSSGASFTGDMTDRLAGVSSAYGWTLMSSASGLYLYGKIDADFYKLDSATMTDDVVTGNTYGSYLGIQFDNTTSASATEAVNTGWLIMNDMDGTVKIGEGYTLTQQGLVTGTKGLLKTGAGTLVIERENEYQGGTAIEEGKLILKDAGTLGTGTTLANSGTFEINNNEDREFTTVISGYGNVVKSGTGALTLSVPNTFSGDMDITEGTVVMAYNANIGGTVKTATALGDPSVEGRKITIHSGATLATESSADGHTRGIDVFGGADAYPKFRLIADGGTIATATNELTTYGDIELKNGGSFVENGGHSYWKTIINGNVYVTEGNATISSVNNDIGIVPRGLRNGVEEGVTFDVAQGSELNVTAHLSDSRSNLAHGAVIKAGKGTMTLSNSYNDYSGNVTINEGKLIAAGSWRGANTTTVFGKYQSKSVTVNKDAELVLAAQDVVSNSSTNSPIQFIVNGGKISNSGTVYNNLNNTVLTNGAQIYASNGNNPWQAYKFSTTVSVLRNADDSAADPVLFSSDLSKPNATISFGKTTSIYVEDVTSASSTALDKKSDMIVSAIIAKPNNETGGSFYKDGVGTLEFTTANTFDGTVGIREGVLRLSGEGTLSDSIVDIVDGATLEFAVASGEKWFTNTITGDGQILKTGAGSLYLNGTDVNPITASSLLVEGGSLMFKGDFTGDVIIGAGTLLSAGNSVGTLNVTGDVTIDGTALFEFGSYTGADENHDVIALGADYVFSAGDNMISLYFENGDASSWATEGSEYLLIANGGFAEGDYSSLLGNYTDLFGLLGKSDGLYLIAGAGPGPGPGPEPGSGVPEPSTLALLLLGAAGLLYWRKRK